MRDNLKGTEFGPLPWMRAGETYTPATIQGHSEGLLTAHTIMVQQANALPWWRRRQIVWQFAATCGAVLVDQAHENQRHLQRTVDRSVR